MTAALSGHGGNRAAEHRAISEATVGVQKQVEAARPVVMIGESLWLDDVTWVERHPGQRGKSEIQFTGRWSGGIPIDETDQPGISPDRVYGAMS